MLPSLSPSLDHLQLLPAILYAVDEHLYAHVSKTRPFFALAATLTLYAHEIQEFGEIARLFDFLLAQEAAVSVYFFAVIILSRKQELLDIPDDEPEMLHFTLSKLPCPLDLEALIRQTVRLFSAVPPENLPFRAWKKVPRCSVLKTTRKTWPETKRHSLAGSSRNSIADGIACFDRQVVQLRRSETRQRLLSLVWRYRHFIGGIGLAMLVGACSMSLQGHPSEGISVVSQWTRRINIPSGLI